MIAESDSANSDSNTTPSLRQWSYKIVCKQEPQEAAGDQGGLGTGTQE